MGMADVTLNLPFTFVPAFRRTVEREVILTGIGGQAPADGQGAGQAAADRVKQVMLFGVYEGMMRGGSADRPS